MSAVDNWREHHPPTRELSRLEHRLDNDPGFRQYIQREVILDVTFRRQRDLVAYRCLKASLFPMGAIFDDSCEWGDYDPRHAARVIKSAEKAGLIEESGRSRHDRRSKTWRTPFHSSEDGLALWNDIASGGPERVYGPTLGEVSTIQRLLYGHSAIQDFHLMHGDTDLSFLHQLMRGQARIFQREFADDADHARVIFRRWLTHLEHKPGIAKSVWASFDHYAQRPAYVEGMFHNITHMMLAEWFNRQTRQTQDTWLRTEAIFRVSREDIRDAFRRVSHAPSWQAIGLETIESIAALHQLGQHSAADELAALAAGAAENPFEQGFYLFRRAQIARDLSDFDSAARLHQDAAACFELANKPLYQAIAMCSSAESAFHATGAAALRALDGGIALGATLREPVPRFVFYHHLGSIYRQIGDPGGEMAALLETLKSDALCAGETDLHMRVDRRIALLQESKKSERR